METTRQQWSDRHPQPAQSCASIDIAWRFRRGQEGVLVRVRDIGDEVEIWTLAAVGSEAKTQTRERSAKPQDIVPYLLAMKNGFLKDGWETTQVPRVWKARTAKTTNHLRNDRFLTTRPVDITGPAAANDILPRPRLLAAPAPEQEVEPVFEVVE